MIQLIQLQRLKYARHLPQPLARPVLRRLSPVLNESSDLLQYRQVPFVVGQPPVIDVDAPGFGHFLAVCGRVDVAMFVLVQCSLRMMCQWHEKNRGLTYPARSIMACFTRPHMMTSGSFLRNGTAIPDAACTPSIAPGVGSRFCTASNI